MPKVSIIIPFYNVEDYIEECLRSVLSQTLKDIEIILINDASTDKTKSIVDSYAKNDNRIKILEVDTRHGQGYARNRGIEIATGEYIGFVDSDDFVEKNMFETLYNKAKETDSDITMCQVKEYDDMNAKYSTSDYYALTILEKFQDNIFSADDTKEQLLDINVALWNKIYKREYLLNTGEKFPEGYIYEDLPFFFGTYLPAKRINIVWKSLYSYRTNRKNSTMQQFNNKILDRSPMVALTYEKLKKLPYFEEIKKEVQAWIINDLFHRYTLLKENFHREFFFLMKKTFQNLEIENIEDEYWKKVYHFQGYLLVINNTFEEFNQKVFNEYLDIHKIENRLHSELADHYELDRRFNLVYGDLNKAYKYTEKLNDELKERIKLLYNDVKDLSFVIQNNYVELNKEQYNQLENTNKAIENINNNISAKINEFSCSYNQSLNSVQSTIENRINENETNIKTELKTSIDELKDIIENQKLHYENIISNMQTEFNSKIKNQEFQHNEEIQLLKEEIKQLEANLREEMKSPLTKFIEKYNRNKQLVKTPNTAIQNDIQAINNENEDAANNLQKAE
ncbi:glycosyltransferase [bacterium]|nr:glycosyltransferase [bacterium]